MLWYFVADRKHVEGIANIPCGPVNGVVRQRIAFVQGSVSHMQSLQVTYQSQLDKSGYHTTSCLYRLLWLHFPSTSVVAA